MAKVQFNCRLDKEIAKWIAEQAESHSERQGKKVSQADIIKMLVLSSPFNVPVPPERTEMLTAQGSDPASIPGVQVGPRSKCDHCGQMRAPRRVPLCTVCLDAGHSGEPRNCGECTAGMAA